MFAMRLPRPIMTLLLVMVSFPTSAQVFRWVADDGSVHYGDRPPETVSVQALDISSVATTDPSGLRAGEAQRLERIDARRQQARDHKSQLSGEGQQIAQEQDARACEQHTQRHQALRKSLRAGYQGGEGDRLRRQLREARKAMNRHC